MHSKQLIVSFIILIIVGIPNVAHTFEVNSECWSATDCLVEITMMKQSSPSQMHTSTTQNCTFPRTDGPNLSPKYCKEHSNFNLNGCNVDRTGTIGTEYIDEPDCVQSLIIENFPAARIPSESFVNFTRLTELILQNNAFTRIKEKNFHGLKLLEHLELRTNNLQIIDNGPFVNLPKLRNLTIIEPTLQILRNLSFGNVIEYLYIEAKTLEWPYLPDSLIDFTMFNTTALINFYHEITYFGHLYQLRSFSMHFSEHVFLLNITSNTMEKLNFTDNDMDALHGHLQLINLITFDISRNKFKEVNQRMLHEMKKLEIFLAADNIIEYVSDRAFVNNTRLKYVDLSNNRLRKLSILFPEVSSTGPPSQRILVNGNPWGCDWLLKTLLNRHDLFDCFEFESIKTGNHVLGLQCKTENNTQMSTTSEPPSSQAAATMSATTTTIISVVSVALACLIILSIILYIKHRQHAWWPFQLQGGNFLQNIMLRRQGQAVPEADNVSTAEETE